jgi:hypothetical protein
MYKLIGRYPECSPTHNTYRHLDTDLFPPPCLQRADDPFPSPSREVKYTGIIRIFGNMKLECAHERRSRRRDCAGGKCPYVRRGQMQNLRMALDLR